MKNVFKAGCALLLLPIVAVFALVTSPVWVPLLWWGFKIAVLILVVRFCYGILEGILK